MVEYDNTEQCVLFKEENKESETHPDWKGSGNHNGSDCWASGWNNISKTGKEYISIKFKKKESLKAAVSKSQREEEIETPF